MAWLIGSPFHCWNRGEQDIADGSLAQSERVLIVSFLEGELRRPPQRFHRSVFLHEQPSWRGDAADARRNMPSSIAGGIPTCTCCDRRWLHGVPPTLEHPGFSTLHVVIRSHPLSVSGCLVWMNLVPGQPSLCRRVVSSFLAHSFDTCCIFSFCSRRMKTRYLDVLGSTECLERGRSPKGAAHVTYRAWLANPGWHE